MFKPSLKSVWTLVVLSLISYGLYNWAEFSRVPQKQPHYDEKLAAARLMENWIGMLKEAKAPEAAFVDEVNDPARTLLIGQKHTLITSTEGNHQAKLATTNPNTAAMMVQIFKEAGLEKGDKVALAVTGSFPGLNLAAYAACKVLELQPVVITSVSSSWYGATDPDFNWLDMEKVLADQGQIPFRSVAASIGGADDRGRSLSPEGRRLVLEAMRRNGVHSLNGDSLSLESSEDEDISAAVDARMQAYQDAVSKDLKGYSAYINIGGGVVSLGHPWATRGICRRTVIRPRAWCTISPSTVFPSSTSSMCRVPSPPCWSVTASPGGRTMWPSPARAACSPRNATTCALWAWRWPSWPCWC
jgi:poly-gamma-glutamate system protein